MKMALRYQDVHPIQMSKRRHRQRPLLESRRRNHRPLQRRVIFHVDVRNPSIRPRLRRVATPPSSEEHDAVVIPPQRQIKPYVSVLPSSLGLLLIHATANDETRGSVLFCIVKPFLRKRKQRHRSSETTTNIYLLTTKHESFTSYGLFSPHRAEKLNIHDPPLRSIPRFSAHGPRITRPSGAR
jgi:hypothetical protein